MLNVSTYQPGFPISVYPAPVSRSELVRWSLVSNFGACQSSLTANIFLVTSTVTVRRPPADIECYNASQSFR